MKKIVVANWKMHGSSMHCCDYILALRPYLSPNVDLTICPPFPYLLPLRDDSWNLGGQNCHTLAEGAFTGEVSAPMLRDIGCKYVLIGHSERRKHNNETDTCVTQKCTTAQSAGLVPIICVGETESEKASNLTQAVIAQQLAAIPSDKVLIAYEPVWAIGTGITATTEDIVPVFEMIKKTFPTQPVLYGGSVKADNALELLSLAIVDGVLVGGASLDPHTLGKIIKAGEQAHATT
ncbi:MAG: triose-phosphate isomerase [Alphaproteobacteria bacterium]